MVYTYMWHAITDRLACFSSPSSSMPSLAVQHPVLPEAMPHARSLPPLSNRTAFSDSSKRQRMKRLAS